MIADLHAADAPASLAGDVCIVGGGAAGAYLAHRLSAKGTSVVVVEAGGLDVTDCVAAGFEPETRGERYGGVFEGRAFGLGGTSALWGGLLIPYDPAFDVRVDLDAPTWRHIVEINEKHKDVVRAVLGAKHKSDYESSAQRFFGPSMDAVRSAGIEVRVSEMLPFSHRNLARLVLRGSAQVVVHAVASEWKMALEPSGARVTSLVACSRDRRRIEVTARQFVIAAGAIESARILLEIDEATEGRVLAGRAALGRGLSDHLSTRIANVDDAAFLKARALIGPRFSGRLMRAARLIDTELLGAHPRHFAHFVFGIQSPGFALAKKVFGSIQARRAPDVGIGELAKGLSGLTALGFDRFVRRRLHVPRGTPIGLQLDVEQRRDFANSVSLSSRRDEYGRRCAEIQWAIGDHDRSAIHALRSAILQKWESLGDAVPRAIATDADRAIEKLHDAYHPVGVCALDVGTNGVLTPDLLVRGLVNLRALTTGAFPSAGSANPTLALLCFAEELAQTLPSKLREA